jgi:hypothetical protein
MSIYPANATLTFQVPIAPSLGAVDGYGNPIATTQDLIVSAYLKEGTREQDGDLKDGNETIRVELEGRCISPEKLPLEVAIGSRADCEVRDAIGNVAMVGEFYLDASVPSAWGVDEVLGGKIRGYLITRIRWGTAA